MIKRNKDKDIQARLTEYICDIILLFEKIKNGIGNWFKSREHLKKQTDKNIRGIFKANNTPKSFTGCNYTYIRLDFLHGDPKKLFEICLKNIPTSKDLSDISFKEGYAYVRGLKYVGQLFDLGDTKHTREFIETTDGIIDDWVKLTILPDSREWKEADKSLKIIF